ncbi:MAG TPA: lysophospholipid acyltransferase family protein [Thermoanaerobaculia bacterium]|nr:lysophospholipid acyltransferase family protein [Thermoanaerobaculia bacterium]
MSQSSASPPSPRPAVDAPASSPSPLALPAFRRSGERRLARHFHAVRLSRSQRPDLTAARDRPVIVYLHHSSWWDPLVCLQLASQLFPGRSHFAPLEQATLRRDRLFARLGFFAVDVESARGARRFLELATRIVERPDAILWVTAGGGMADPRERPVKLLAGLGHLAARVRHAVMLPLALEYPFWNEPRPEALARFGEELAVEDAGMRAHDWTEVLAARLEAAQDALAAEALARDAACFEVIQDPGAAGGGLQDAWRRFREILRARRRRPLRGVDPGGA